VVESGRAQQRTTRHVITQVGPPRGARRAPSCQGAIVDAFPDCRACATAAALRPPCCAARLRGKRCTRR
jgi:hypothetical protein